MRTQGLVLSHLSQLGLRSTGKRANSCRCRGSLFPVWSLDSVNQTARLTQERAQSVLNCLNTFKNRTAAPLKQFQRLLGHMAAAAAVTPLGLLHMRPLQHWLHGRVPRWAWQSGTLRVQVTPACRQTFTPWSDLSFLRAGVPLEQVSRHAVVYTMPPPRFHVGCSVGGLDGSPTALAHQLPRVAGSTPGLEPSQETLTRRAVLSVRTALRPLRTSTDKVVYAPVACRNSPATSSSGVGSI